MCTFTVALWVAFSSPPIVCMIMAYSNLHMTMKMARKSRHTPRIVHDGSREKGLCSILQVKRKDGIDFKKYCMFFALTYLHHIYDKPQH